MIVTSSGLQVLRLLQLASSTLPVGAYSYSEGLELLVETGQIQSVQALQDWMSQELHYGTLRMEAGIMLRAHQATLAKAGGQLLNWNRWWSAARESEELRLQSWQMGRSLLRLFFELEDPILSTTVNKTWPILQDLWKEECNFAIAFGLVAASWQLEPMDCLLGYVQSWATNLISAGIKLIPLGQTSGQQLLLQLQPELEQAAQEILTLPGDALESCGWGLAIASMSHETLYSRLFRS